MITLTWRVSRDGSLEAAYLGTVRVGYVTGYGLWWTNLLRPGGGAAAGREAGDPARARQALTAAVEAWVASAGLANPQAPRGPRGLDQAETVLL